jgi:hypothetical protein
MVQGAQGGRCAECWQRRNAAIDPSLPPTAPDRHRATGRPQARTFALYRGFSGATGQRQSVRPRHLKPRPTSCAARSGAWWRYRRAQGDLRRDLRPPRRHRELAHARRLSGARRRRREQSRKRLPALSSPCYPVLLLLARARRRGFRTDLASCVRGRGRQGAVGGTAPPASIGAPPYGSVLPRALAARPLASAKRCSAGRAPSGRGRCRLTLDRTRATRAPGVFAAAPRTAAAGKLRPRSLRRQRVRDSRSCQLDAVVRSSAYRRHVENSAASAG